ncbi:MAG: metal-dependent hydrolase [Nitrososphaerales archaeon]
MEPLIHFVVPFAALMLVGFKFRKAMLLSLFALTPDLDALFLIHRSFTHSILFLLLVAVFLLLIFYKIKPKLLRYGFIALFSTLSHVVLDLPSGYTPILWPLYNYSIWFQGDLFAHIGSAPTLSLNLHILTEPITFRYLGSLDAPLFTGSSLILALTILTPFFVKIIVQRFRS